MSVLSTEQSREKITKPRYNSLKTKKIKEQEKYKKGKGKLEEKVIIKEKKNIQKKQEEYREGDLEEKS